MGGGQSSPVRVDANSAPQMTETKRNVVVIPVDQSTQAEAAFEWYARHLHRPSNVVRVLHCRESIYTPYFPGHTFKLETYKELHDQSMKISRDIQEKYRQKMVDYKMHGQVEVAAGAPGEMVVKAADTDDAGMIVMGTRGFGIVRRTILGSVSEYVIHHCKVPVTVVPRETTSWFF